MTNRSDEVDRTQSKWLRDAKLALLNRDPVDAVNDVEALLKFAQNRLDQLLPHTSKNQ